MKSKIKIGKQIELSDDPHSIIVTDGNGTPEYKAPGLTNTVLGFDGNSLVYKAIAEFAEILDLSALNLGTATDPGMVSAKTLNDWLDGTDNFIKNQFLTPQSASFWISGLGKANVFHAENAVRVENTTNGFNSHLYGNVLRFFSDSANYIDFGTDATSGNTGSLTFRVGSDYLPAFRINNGGSVYLLQDNQKDKKLLKTNSNGLIQGATAQDVADTLGTGHYIQNQIAAPQASSNFWVSGTGSASVFNAINSNGSTDGYVRLVAGSSSVSGYIDFRKPGNVRLGYIGFSQTDMVYYAEHGAKHNFFGGNVVVNNAEFAINSSAAYTTHLNYQNLGINIISQANSGSTQFRKNAGTFASLNSSGYLILDPIGYSTSSLGSYSLQVKSRGIYSKPNADLAGLIVTDDTDTSEQLQIYRWGIQSTRSNTYLRPNTNGTLVLNIGYNAGNLRWHQINIDASNINFGLHKDKKVLSTDTNGYLVQASSANIADVLGSGHYIQNQYANVQSGSFNISGYGYAGIFAASSFYRSSRLGYYGTYNSTELQGIWSISSGYKINTASNSCGNQYGIVYGHTLAGQASPTGWTQLPITSWGHQIMFTENGYVRAAISLTQGHIWARRSLVLGNDTTLDKIHLNPDGYSFFTTTQSNYALLRVAESTNNGARIGYTAINLNAYSGFASVSHTSMTGAGQYAVLQNSSGDTFVNAASGQTIYFRNNNVSKVSINTHSINVGRTGGIANIKGDTGMGDGHIMMDSANSATWVALNYYNDGKVVLGYGGGQVLVNTTSTSSPAKLFVNGSIGQNSVSDVLLMANSSGTLVEANQASVVAALTYTPVASSALNSYVLKGTNITINGVTKDFNSDRTWNIDGSKWTNSGSDIYRNSKIAVAQIGFNTDNTYLSSAAIQTPNGIVSYNSSSTWQLTSMHPTGFTSWFASGYRTFLAQTSTNVGKVGTSGDNLQLGAADIGPGAAMININYLKTIYIGTEGGIHNNSYRLYVDSNSTTGDSLYVKGTIYATDDIEAFSDKRVKHDFKVIQNALSLISRISGYSYYRNGDPVRRRGGHIAQEIQEILPYAVREDEKGFLSLQDRPILALHTEAIKELNNKQISLEEEVIQLRARVKELEDGSITRD